MIARYMNLNSESHENSASLLYKVLIFRLNLKGLSMALNMIAIL